ncbi:hypothetical protein ABB37_07584 [Leptomonas pyrrhocoris]|uniref:Uncharacterized protein n=1 Tax=Leptomonas pyrrhocoris TaxID=157538 RepID=A0A0M9FVE3_LEPPY|nr:hypothetical protein ABB37_07584 [Leptomonas pyrrhocoris]KPA76759.1 hypothetical protein ABB37_07584 [Leptomonas pyrrhocoris]|eukprot:XP_015655198.1 hypothetical protein ABB37_07584 [Leptomonas pyrrhocoris]
MQLSSRRRSFLQGQAARQHNNHRHSTLHGRSPGFQGRWKHLSLVCFRTPLMLLSGLPLVVELYAADRKKKRNQKGVVMGLFAG